MSCPNIYLGTGRFGAPPLLAEYGNDAIGLTSYTLTENVQVFIQLTANNHGTDDSPSTLMELFWSDPSTGFQALAARSIGSLSAIIPGATTGPMGQTDGNYPHNFAWKPDSTVLGTNGGHVCLLARLENNTAPGGACTQQSYNSSSPATDPLSAIHNVQIIAPPPPPPPRRGPGWRMGFAFAALNTLRDLEETKLEVRVLDPAHDRLKLEQLVAVPAVDRALASRCLKFAVPNEVLLAEGRERVIVDPHRHGTCVPRIGKLGPLDEPALRRLTQPGTRPVQAKGPAVLHLLHGESRQMLLEVEPSGRENVAYAIEVQHHGADGRNIGGLVFVFVPPHKYF